MMRLLPLLALLGLIPFLANAADTYEIKIKKSAKGDVMNVTSQETGVEKTIVAKDGMVLKEDGKSKKTSVAYVEEILEKPAGKKPTSMTRVYSKAETVINGKNVEHGFVGKKVTITSKGGKYEVLVDGKAPTGADAEFFNKEFANKNDKEDDELNEMLPKKAVAVGDKWDINPKKIVEGFLEGAKGGVAIDEKGVKSFGTLSKAYKKDGKQFGVIEVTVIIPLTAIKSPGGDIAFKGETKLEMKTVMDVCIDGTSSEGNASMGFKMKGDASLMGIDLTIDVSNESKTVAVPKK